MGNGNSVHPACTFRIPPPRDVVLFPSIPASPGIRMTAAGSGRRSFAG
ncbi:MAG: hypothetical protein PHI63_00405 [Patescibacteria group bacterium]|nr:hypothetical protein [Patescibacteria group bacterium]